MLALEGNTACPRCSIVKLEPKLDYARICCSSRDGSEGAFARLSAGRKYTIRLSKCRRVCQVEYLGTKLQVHLFSQWRVLDKRRVFTGMIGRPAVVYLRPNQVVLQHLCLASQGRFPALSPDGDVDSPART
jgi:hypothetical protein